MNSSRQIDLGAFADSPFAQQLRSGFRWLRFPGDLERQFEEFHLWRVRSRVRVFFCILPLLEIVRLIEAKMTGLEATLSLRILPNWLFIFAGGLVLWSRWYWRFYLPGATVVAAIFLCVASYFIPVYTVGPTQQQVLQFILNTPVVTYLLLGLPFYRATLINAVCAVVYSISVSQTGVPTPDLFSCISAILFSTITAAVLSYTAERASRTQFLQERLLGEVASRDGLTRLQNRAAFDEHLGRLWKHAQRTREPVALLLIDVDHFKGFNDTLGHQAGDECLRQIAAILKDHARRPLDLSARYGGEEFAIILFQTPLEQVRAIAEAIRAAVEALGIINPSSTYEVVTISCGMATVMPLPGRSAHGLVELADEALYDAKEGGRNRVVLAEVDYANMRTGRFRNRNHLRAVR